VVTAWAVAFDARTVDVGVACAGVFVGEIGVETVLTQPVGGATPY
jgi:hypothetical protein